MKEPVENLALFRGIGWAVVAILGAIFITKYSGELDMPAYVTRWLGNLLKIASVVFGSYRVSRDVFKIDPSTVASTPVAFAILHLARVLLCGFFAWAVCSGV